MMRYDPDRHGWYEEREERYPYRLQLIIILAIGAWAIVLGIVDLIR